MSYQFFEVEDNLHTACPLSIWYAYEHILNLYAPTESTLSIKETKTTIRDRETDYPQ